MADTRFSGEVNREHTSNPTLNPASHGELLAAAVDGRDYRMIATLVLAHPGSKFLPQWFIGELGNIVFSSEPELTALVERRVLAAGNLFLRIGGNA